MKANKLYRWVVSLLSLLPMVFIGARSLYVSLNKNAYQSYSSQSLYQNISIDDYHNVNIGTKYTLTEKDFDTNGSQFNITFDYISLTPTDLGVDQATYNTINSFLINANWQEIRFTNNSAPTAAIVRYAWEEGFSFDIVFSSTNHSLQYINTWFFVNQIFYTTDKLDNAFTYSIKEFNEVGFDKINFVNWFTNVFTLNADNMYVHFVNSYCNYLLFVNAVMVLPYFLYWFINFTIHLLDSFIVKERKK